MDDVTLGRFLKKVRILPNGCWLWLGKASYQNYGYFWLGQKSRLAHRVSHEHYIGLIPDGYQVDHKCHTDDEACRGGRCEHRMCVNPEHLEAVVARENVMRSRGLAAKNAAKTHCGNGHELTPENVYEYPSGERGCKTCRATWVRTWSAKRNPDAVPMSERTHCPQNHEYTPENTYLSKSGRRHCRTCKRAWDAAHKAEAAARYQAKKAARQATAEQ